MAESLVVASKVKDVLKASDMNMGGDMLEGLSKEVENLVKKAIERCKANDRKTVRACDL